MVVSAAMVRSLTVALACALALGCGAEGEDPKPARDTGVARPDASTDAARPDASDATAAESGSDGDRPEAPSPIEDTSSVEDFGVPPPGSRVEGLIGAAGGTLEGATSTKLAGVKLVVPAGALASDVLFALDYADAPFGAPGEIVSPYVRVGPDGVAFARPARLTLPTTKTVASIAAVARIGFSWSSLHEPTGGSASVTASMRRTSGAALVSLDLSATTPKITLATPSGTTLFIDGTGFGVAQVFQPGADGGAPFVSNVTYGGVIGEILGWSATSISIRIPDTDAGTTVTVTTPGGSSSL